MKVLGRPFIGLNVEIYHVRQTDALLKIATMKLPQCDGHLQLENVDESILWQENTTF